MIYSNRVLKANKKIMDLGVCYELGMGEKGQGRKFMELTCYKDTEVQKGMNLEYTIIIANDGKPKIVRKSEKKLYMLLSAEGGYTKRGNGTIEVLSSQKRKFKILARGNGADGTVEEKIGFWDCILLEVPLTDVIVRVHNSGEGYGIPSELYLINNGNVYKCHINELKECCKSLGIEVPCKVIEEDGKLRYGNDWTTL